MWRCPTSSHLLHHELDGPRLLHGFEVEHLTTGNEVPTADHLAAIPGRLGAVLVELPLRDAGCILPTFDELTDLSLAARTRGVPLHFDGARIWEAQPYWNRPFPEIAALAESIYVSFYKGIGGQSGACLAGAADFVDEARRWRKRMGGTIFRMTPEAVSALVGLRDRLPHMAACVSWARALAAALPPTVTTQPPVPHTNTFLLYAAGDVDAINERLLALMLERKVAMGFLWRPSDEPGRVITELAVGSAALHLDPVQVAAWIADVVG